ncbi:hypothetical protein HPB47_020806, partial [Ixodes persulcatus]
LCKACANAATNAVDSRDISVLCGIDTTGDTVGVSGLSTAVIAAEFRSASPVDVATSAKNITFGTEFQGLSFGTAACSGIGFLLEKSSFAGERASTASPRR